MTSTPMIVDKEYLFQCPNCLEYINVLKKDVKCGIFRHAVYKKSMKQVNPHSSKKKCKSLVKQGRIYGCGKPFKLEKSSENDGFLIKKCGYI